MERPAQKMALLLTLIACVWIAPACKRGASDERKGGITYVAPTPAPIEIFWIDSAGNLGLRGVEAVVPGAPLPAEDPKAGKLPPNCRESATANGTGTLTVCMSPTVGRVLAEKLGLEWTSGHSGKP